MLNRIDGNSPSALNSTNSPSTEPAKSAKEAPTVEPMQYDDWDYSENYRDFVPQYEGPTREAAANQEDSFSVWEARGVADTQHNRDQVDNAIARKIADSIDSGRLTDTDVAACDAGFDIALDQIVYSSSSTNELVSGLIDEDQLAKQLRTEFSRIDGLSNDEIDRAVEHTIEQSKDVVAQRVSDNVHARIEGPLKDIQKLCQNAADNPRTFAAELLVRTDDPGEMKSAFTQLGVEADEAQAIADKLATIANNPDKRAAFLAGKEGEAEWLTANDSWKDVEVDIADALGEIAEDVGLLASRSGNDVLTNSRILTSGLWEGPRTEVLVEAKSEMTPEEARTFDEIIAEARASGERDDKIEGGVKFAVGAILALSSGGFAALAGLGMSVASSAESVNSAYADYDAARVADTYGMAAENELENAKVGLGISIVVAMGSTGLSAKGVHREMFEGASKAAEEGSPYLEAGATWAVEEGARFGANKTLTD